VVAYAAHGDENVIMDRRAFFKLGAEKISKTAVKLVDDKVNQRASHWIRPPYALDELEFLLACTRCDKCIEACPHDVVFKLPAKLGVQVVGTPAMDLLNKGCHLCKDWPCVEACEPRALQFPEVEEGEVLPLAKLAYAEINTQTCLPYSGPECGACESSCSVEGALKWDMTKPYIDPELCTGCGLCREACIVDPKAVNIKSLLQQQTESEFDEDKSISEI
jgi:ferredoxin-type protein NapG